VAMDGKRRSDATLGQRLRHELLQYGLISAYLYVCFVALIFYKVSILRGEGISYAPLWAGGGEGARSGEVHAARPCCRNW
ncbi:MAG: hypothetical protein ABI369_12845, partial [Acetobacteraceae bacterium]